jgi:hypothetical protein
MDSYSGSPPSSSKNTGGRLRKSGGRPEHHCSAAERCAVAHGLGNFFSPPADNHGRRAAFCDRSPGTPRSPWLSRRHPWCALSGAGLVQFRSAEPRLASFADLLPLGRHRRGLAGRARSDDGPRAHVRTAGGRPRGPWLGAGRLTTAGYDIRSPVDTPEFAERRREHAGRIAAVAEHLGTPRRPRRPCCRETALV